MAVARADVPTKAGTKTNERPGTRAQVKYVRMSAYKARQVLDLVRGKDVRTADEVLQFSERDAALVVRKLLRSAVANAEHNDSQAADDLYVSACYADEGKTIRRFRPRARGRATRIRKRSCHITLIVSRMPDAQLERRRAKEATRPGSRAARVRGQRAASTEAPVQEEQPASRRRRRRRGGGQPSAADVAAAEEEQGIVDQQAEAVALAEEIEDNEDVGETDVSDQESTAEEQGIVDQQDAALEAMDQGDEQGAPTGDAEGVADVAGASGSPESELAAQDADEEQS